MSLRVCPEVYRDEPLIVEIIDRAQQIKNIDSARQYLEGLIDQYPAFTKLSITSYRYKDFFIDLGPAFVMAPYAYFLFYAVEYQFSCLSEPVAIIRCGYKENTILLITRIEGSEGRRILRFDHCDVEGGISELAKRRLLEDVEKMISLNTVIYTLGSDTRNWYLVEGLDRIILSNASGFASFASDNAKEIFRQIIKDCLHWRE